MDRAIIPWIRRLCICLAMLPAAHTFAQGPGVIAIGDRHLWTERVDTPGGFDRASRAAILVYVRELQKQKDSEARLFRRPTVMRWLDKELALSRSNYQNAAKGCSPADWTCVRYVNDASDLTVQANTLVVPTNLTRWNASITKFALDYIAEQVRLAALFPRTTSEIDLFDVNEFNGDGLADRKFFLTFDDGPTPADGNTDGVLQMLAANKKTGVFFLLGGNLKGRLSQTGVAKLAIAYQGQCVGSHGWQHRSHAAAATWSDGRTWRTSVTDTQALLRSVFSDDPGLLPLFRPPYGERRADSGAFFRERGIHVALWDIDSQDWNPQLNADDVTNRIENLMLLKRHGILLFHDVFPKARAAVPVIIGDFGAAVDWGNCKQISEAF